MTDAQAIANQLGSVKPDDEWLEAEIARLRGKNIMPLQHVIKLHDWLDGKRKARKSCRVVGESRTGKTVACDAYRYRQKVQIVEGRPPIVPVVYIQPPPKCGAKELFQEIIEHLKFKATKGTVSDFRGRTMEVLKACSVEMVIVDEADRIKPENFAEVRDIYDKLGIAVVLVGTDRLDAVIKRDEQVSNRFLACYRFGTLAGNDFRDTVQAWEDKILKLPLPSNLISKDMLRILTKATGGYIGRLDEILREAAIRSLPRGFKKIDKAVLEEVAKEYE
jgi:DNA transposition AAA+ family ATPase